MKKDKKRFLCIFTACLLIVTACIPAFAQDSKQHIQYYEDGSYTIETLTIDNPTISFYSSTKRGTRSRIYYSSDNVEQWSVTVTGSFSYGNGSSTHLLLQKQLLQLGLLVASHLPKAETALQQPPQLSNI